MSTDEIVSKYAVSDGKEIMKFQQMIEDYVLVLQTKISNGETIAATGQTGQTMIPPIKLLCEMNDIILNWRKINRLLPRASHSASDDAYTKEQIKRMLQYSDLRAKIAILFMSSGRMRLGGLDFSILLITNCPS